ncbi:hypothetical protein MPNT_30018 [Candidatus Methylacidithermus pantelleriae]|uniref:Uncharacterized protein n=1 Tax=Candidatus Methylacidithermus pantelleriae TaxID=2744239 RepID=A0A8J2BLA3_9BACT|nr:hypothetical protein MPNT_30018 [Candidatus Methylacidithermus pantelleriae]
MLSTPDQDLGLGQKKVPAKRDLRGALAIKADRLGRETQAMA